VCIYRSAALLQKIVKRNFEQSTVITIARRLKTVIDADRIMVMDNGKIKELDPPHLLLQMRKEYSSTSSSRSVFVHHVALQRRSHIL